MKAALVQRRIDIAFAGDNLREAIRLVNELLGWSWRIGNLPSGRHYCELGANGATVEADTPARAMLENLSDHMTAWRDI